MIVTRKFCFVSVIVPAIGLLGCAQTPMGPMVQVMPGPHKSFDAFRADGAYCQQYSTQQVAGQAQAANNQAIGGALLATALGAGLGAAVGGGQGAGIGAAAGAGLGAGGAAGASGAAQGGIQQQYDNAYSQCMYSKGNQVAGYQPLDVGPEPGGRPMAQGPNPALVRAVQSELIRLSYLSGNADGQLGGRTSGAIRSFERAGGLPVDGTVSPRLLAKLQSTPGSGAAVAAAPAGPSGWVAPSQAAATGAPPPASGASGWVTPVAAPQ
jgi:hypothetical protein